METDVLKITPRILKKTHKNLMIIEASFIYCKRHGLDEENFIEDTFMTDDFSKSEEIEFDKICNDLRGFRGCLGNYELREISVEEYELCVDKFGAE